MPIIGIRKGQSGERAKDPSLAEPADAIVLVKGKKVAGTNGTSLL
jgi:hypothetical protein